MKEFKRASIDANKVIMNCLVDIQNLDVSAYHPIMQHSKRLTLIGYGIFGLMVLAFTFGMPDVVLASEPGGEVFARANTAMQGVLRQIRTISSIIAALFLTIAFLMKMFSKSQRTVDEANTWIKRIAIAWACINAVGFILTFIQEIIGPDVALPTIN